MPRKHSLTRADFEALKAAKGRRVHGRYFSLHIAPLTEGRGGPRTATVVAKKVAGKAVVRKKIRRRCRETLRSILPRLDRRYAYVLYAKGEAKGASSSEIAADIERLFSPKH